MKLDVLSAMCFIAEDWGLVKPTTIKNCFLKCHFLNSHVSGDNDSAMKLSEEDDWHSLQPLGMQFEDYITCDSALEVCAIQSANQVLHQSFAISEVTCVSLIPRTYYCNVQQS
jgi:hypothetical protein